MNVAMKSDRGTSLTLQMVGVAAEVLSKAAGRNLPVATVTAFLWVAQGGKSGADQSALVRSVGVSKNRISAMMSQLGDTPYKEQDGNLRDGLGWVHKSEDYLDKRIKVQTLTDKGRALFDEIKRRTR